MKILSTFRFFGIIALILGIAVGCASVETSKPQTSADAIAEAKAAIAKAKSLKWIWRDTGKLLKQAEGAAKKGEEAKAIKLANQARDQANLAIKQYHHEKRANRGIEPISGMMGSYTVSKGDSLWAISAKNEIYADPYQWPLIYKANSDSIKDADLIFPGQVFSINTSPAPGDVQAAIHHARNRGAWSIGPTEASDRNYLAQ